MPRISPTSIRVSMGERQLVTLSPGIAPMAKMADEHCDSSSGFAGDALWSQPTVQVPLEVTPGTAKVWWTA